jgi:hypothetical protein
MAITKEQANRILEANLINLAKKVADGGTLTPKELELVESASTEAEQPTKTPVFAQNKVELAGIMGVDRKTIDRWLKLPGAPGARSNGKYSVAEWKEWANREDRGSDDDAALDISAAKLHGENLKNWRIAFKNAEMQAQYWPKDVIRRVCAQAIQAAKTRSFSGLPRMVAVIKLAKDDDAALEAARKEMIQVWKQMESVDWFQPAEKPEGGK